MNKYRHDRKRPVAFGFVGAGGYGVHHLNAFATLEAEGRAELVAICEPNEKCLQSMREQPRFRHVRFYENHREMLQSEQELEAVTVSAPIPFHYEIIRDCLERDLFVYLEKPPVPLIGQLEELHAADAGKRVIVGFQWINSTWVQHIRRWIVEGKLGDVTSIRTCACWPRSDSYYNRSGGRGA